MTVIILIMVIWIVSQCSLACRDASEEYAVSIFRTEVCNFGKNGLQKVFHWLRSDPFLPLLPLSLTTIFLDTTELTPQPPHFNPEAHHPTSEWSAVSQGG